MMAVTSLPPTCAPTDRRTEACIPRSLKKHILALPGFPRPVPKFTKPLQEIRAAGSKGLGMFATADLIRGQYVSFERPLLACMPELPADVLNHSQYNHHQIARITYFQAEKVYQSMVSRMQPADREAYMSLANVHTIEEGPCVGISRTNRLNSGLCDPRGGDKMSGVCERLSRINHRCVNCLFDAFVLFAQ